MVLQSRFEQPARPDMDPAFNLAFWIGLTRDDAEEVVQTANLGNFTPQTTYDLYLGRRPVGPSAGSFDGLIDEANLYNRALAGENVFGEIESQFSPRFLAAGPQSVSTGQHGAAFRRMLARGYAFYRSVGARRMVAKRVTEAGVAVEQLFREEIPIRKKRIEAHCRVTLPHQEAIPVRPFRITAFQPEDVVVKHRENFSTREDR